MSSKKWILGLLLWAGLCLAPVVSCTARLAAADVVIAPENRVPNTKDFGVCWWAAAESVGKQYGIKSLEGLTAKVIADGRGWKDGAHDATIRHWMDATGTKVEANPHAKAPKGAEWVAKKLDAGIPVISCNNVVGANGKVFLHAYLLLKFDRETQLVHYVDSNDVSKVHTKPYKEWYDWWFGRAYAIDPAANAVVAKAGPSPLPKDAVSPLVPVAPQPKFIPIEHPTPGPIKGLTFPSNQDIKDGVRRPDDRLRYGVFGDIGGNAQGYDYYGEFKKRNPAPRP